MRERRQAIRVRRSSLAARLRIAVAAIFIASVGYAFGIRTASDLVIVYRHAPLETVSSEHRRQVAKVRQYLPPGIPLIYIDPADEAWQAGLWQRSFYPDHVVLRTRTAAGASDIRERFRAQGRPIPLAVLTARFEEDAGFRVIVPLLPDDAAGAPLRLGFWSDGPSPR